MMSRALANGVAALKQRMGDDLEGWRWDREHQARPRHPLSGAFPELSELLDPPPIPMSGDGDTPLAGAYSVGDPATVTSLSVARYVFDTADWNSSLWAVPLGSSGHPGSPHYHDQSETWRNVQLVPMEYDWERIATNSETQQRLEPA
jgi:penicillin amidase